MKIAAPRDRLYELRTKIAKGTAEAVKACAEEWEVSEYVATRRILYFGFAAIAATYPKEKCGKLAAEAVKQGTPAAADRGSRGTNQLKR